MLRIFTIPTRLAFCYNKAVYIERMDPMKQKADKIIRPLDYWLKGTFGDITGYIIALPEDEKERNYSLLGLSSVTPDKGPLVFDSYLAASHELREREKAYYGLTKKHISIRGVIIQLREGKIVSAETDEGISYKGKIMRICGILLIIAIISYKVITHMH